MSQTTTNKTVTQTEFSDNENPVKKDLISEVNNRIISLLKKGIIPWHRVWTDYGQPRNEATQRPYSGINAVLMGSTEHLVPYFMSFKQAKKLNGNIRKGAKAVRTLYSTLQLQTDGGRFLNKDEALILQTKGESINVRLALEHSSVFNIEDITGIEFNFPKVESIPDELMKDCDELVLAMPNPPDVEPDGEHTSWYNEKEDTVHIQNWDWFESYNDYHTTLFRYLIQSTGHSKRLNRRGKYDVFQKPTYSEEELIIDMGAAFLAAHVGLEYGKIMTRIFADNQAEDLQGWISALEKDTTLFFSAVTQAQKAVNYILNMRNSDRSSSGKGNRVNNSKATSTNAKSTKVISTAV